MHEDFRFHLRNENSNYVERETFNGSMQEKSVKNLRNLIGGVLVQSNGFSVEQTYFLIKSQTAKNQ